jgi:hypothetical protein
VFFASQVGWRNVLLCLPFPSVAKTLKMGQTPNAPIHNPMLESMYNIEAIWKE